MLTCLCFYRALGFTVPSAFSVVPSDGPPFDTSSNFVFILAGMLSRWMLYVQRVAIIPVMISLRGYPIRAIPLAILALTE